MSVETKNLYTSGSNTQIHPNIVTDGLVFYVDPFNFKSRDRSLILLVELLMIFLKI